MKSEISEFFAKTLRTVVPSLICECCLGGQQSICAMGTTRSIRKIKSMDKLPRCSCCENNCVDCATVDYARAGFNMLG